jgi:single-stranded-DNA-specific exonuclease
MVPLVGENRVLAHYGMKVLRKTRRLGLQKLFAVLKIKKENLNEDDVGFMVTPRINAASRMGHPIDAFNLLVAQNEAEAETVVRHLDNINNERKGVVAGIVKEAKKRIRDRLKNEGEKKIIVLGNPNWQPALLGLAASSIAEEFNRPVFLWGRTSTKVTADEATTPAQTEDLFKGSCRSDGMTDLVEIMEKAKDHFLEFGGHKFSGGFSVAGEKIFDLENILLEASSHVQNLASEILVDAEIKLENISENLITEISRLAPFGVGNEKPIFILRDVIPEKINRFGKNKEHLSINFRDGLHNTRAISFFTSPDQFGDLLKENMKTNLVAHLEKSFWNGSSEIRLRIVDFF